MTERVELEALDLAALLCSRVCHDIISPVGAIINGLEVLDEDNSEDMREFANSLIKRSARQASAKLQFARLAFGAAGSAGAEIDLGDAEKVATGYMEGEKAQFSWEAPRVLMAKNLVKLLLNLILLANAAVPRGGTVHVNVASASPARFVLLSTGPNARVPAAFENAGPRRNRRRDHRCPAHPGLLHRGAGAGMRHERVGPAQRRRRGHRGGSRRRLRRAWLRHRTLTIGC